LGGKCACVAISKDFIVDICAKCSFQKVLCSYNVQYVDSWLIMMELKDGHCEHCYSIQFVILS